jgi:uncharacterized protein (DUF433 family)
MSTQGSCFFVFWKLNVNLVMLVDYKNLITIEPGKRSGKPCVRNLRITVYDVLSYLAAGMSADEIISDFPELTNEDIYACLSYAADIDKHTQLVHSA